MSGTQSELIGYDTLDRFKRKAQTVSARSSGQMKRLGLQFLEWTRGESVQLYEHARFDLLLAQVNEGLGTKNMIADRMFYQRDFRSFDRSVAKDTVAMIVNDMITLGALPISVPMHAAAGSKGWFYWEERCDEFLEGWLEACEEARCGYDSGETPMLRELVRSDSAVLSGSAIGIISPKSRLIKRNIQHMDEILLLASSGVHANGLTKAREIAERHKEGYRAKLSNGQAYGEALLTATHIYVGLVEDMLNAGVDIHYGVNITGHGWRKLMRAPEPFRYVVHTLPHPQPVFEFIQTHGGLSRRDMYLDYNMGAGFALYVPPSDVARAFDVWARGDYPFDIVRAGYIVENDRRCVEFPMDDIEPFFGDELKVR